MGEYIYLYKKIRLTDSSWRSGRMDGSSSDLVESDSAKANARKRDGEMESDLWRWSDLKGGNWREERRTVALAG
jgi:hypothetical protein